MISSFYYNLVSFGDVDGDIKLDDEGVVSVYSRHYKAYLNICWIKSKSKRDSVSNTICRQMGLAKAESRYINIHSI